MSPWFSWTLVALFSWGLWAVLSKLLGNSLSPEQSQAFSTLGVVPIVLGLAFSSRTLWHELRLKHSGLAFAGGVLTCLGNVAYFGALDRGEKVAAVVSITALYPVIIVLLATLLLREKLNLIQGGGLLISLAAVWLFNIRRSEGLISATVLYAILPILLWGVSGFLQKVATNGVSANTAAFVYLAAFIPVALVLRVRQPWPGALSPRGWIIVVGLGFFLAFGNLAVLRAFALGGKAAVIGPLGSLYPVISVPLAVVFLHESVSARELAGIFCALASVAALSWEWRPRAASVASTSEFQREAPN